MHFKTKTDFYSDEGQPLLGYKQGNDMFREVYYINHSDCTSKKNLGQD